MAKPKKHQVIGAAAALVVVGVIASRGLLSVGFSPEAASKVEAAVAAATQAQAQTDELTGIIQAMGSAEAAGDFGVAGRSASRGKELAVTIGKTAASIAGAIKDIEAERMPRSDDARTLVANLRADADAVAALATYSATVFSEYKEGYAARNPTSVVVDAAKLRMLLLATSDAHDRIVERWRRIQVRD